MAYNPLPLSLLTSSLQNTIFPYCNHYSLKLMLYIFGNQIPDLKPPSESTFPTFTNFMNF